MLLILSSQICVIATAVIIVIRNKRLFFKICTSRDAFYKDLKYQLKRGDVKVPDGKKSGIGALLAQAEFGDIERAPTFVYPPYFPVQQWKDGISHSIAVEHRKLKGSITNHARTSILSLFRPVNSYLSLHVCRSVYDTNVLL